MSNSHYEGGAGRMPGPTSRERAFLPDPPASPPGDPPVWCMPDALIADEKIAAEVAKLLKDWGQDKVTNKALGEGLKRLTWQGDLESTDAADSVVAELGLGPDQDDVSVDCILIPAMMPAIGPATDPEPANPALLPALRAADRRDVHVAVVDTGSYQPAGRLAGRVKPSTRKDPIDGDGDGLIDYDGACHGGAIAGIVASGCGARVSAFNALVPDHTFMCDSSVFAALAKANKAGADVINMSWGSYRTACHFPIATNRFVRTHGDTLFVAAAGNDGTDHEWFPAALAAEPDVDNVVSVGAYDTTGPGGPQVAMFSNFGSWVMAYAPGVDVLTDYVSGLRFRYVDGTERLLWGAAYWSGTSFAAPAVAAALVTATDQGGRVLRTWQGLSPGAPLRFS